MVWKRRGEPAQRAAKKLQRLSAVEQLEQRCLLSAGRGTWTIRGDTDPTALSDRILIDRDPENPSMLRATVDGDVVDSRPEARVRRIRIYAGLGDDSVSFDETTGAITRPARIFGGPGDDLLAGASSNDLLDGGDGDDTLRGGDGRDSLVGGQGSNRLEGGPGADSLRGGNLPDTMWGGAGDDRIGGFGGNDRIYGGLGHDVLLGGEGNDTLTARGSDPVVPPGGRAVLAASAAEDETDGAPDGSESDDSDVLDGGNGEDVLVGNGGDDMLRNGREPETLDPVGNCGELARQFARRIRESYQWYFDGFRGGGPGGIVIQDVALFETRLAGAGPAPLTGAPAAGAANQSFSTTNTQEFGVDEADIVKNDGEHVYVVRDNQFIVVDAWPADSADVISRTEIEGGPFSMYVRGEQAVIFSYVYDDFIAPPTGGGPVPLLVARPFFFRPSQLKVTVLDLADPAAPSLVSETYLDGSYVTSRRIDGRMYLVMNNFPNVPSPWVLRTDDGSVAESAEDFEQRLHDLAIESFLPQFRTIDHRPDGAHETTGHMLVDCGDLYATPDTDWWGMTTVLAFDLDAGTLTPVDSASVVGAVQTVYASAENLYLVRQTWHDGSFAAIHKLALGDDVRVEASGEVPGSVLNQFSMDEEGDYFRIATTTTEWTPAGAHSSNQVFVMAEDGESLDIVGSLEGLAVDERIFAARFLGDTGYLVTFRQIDPLFALDLSNPTDPKVVGELHVPGFSRYLHPVDESHLIGIGREGNSLQVSLYDVSDLENPTQVDRYLITPDGGWTWSSAEYDHHAFGYYPEYQTLAIPVDGSRPAPGPDSDGDGVADYQTWVYESDLWVFQLDLSAGFTLLGQVDHESTVQRSLRIADILYSVAYDTMKAQPIISPTDTLAEVSLAPDSDAVV